MLMNSLPVSRRIVKPSDCVLAFGIPTTREEFDRASNSGLSDYASQFRGGWLQYRKLLVSDVEATGAVFRQLGVTIIRDLTIDAFARLFDHPFEAIILFSHWREDAVEFRDGLENISSVLAAVPPTFDRILDLCVCHPMSLVAALHQHRPDCIVKYLSVEAKPHFWIYFYRTLFFHLQASDISYLTAIQEVACAFLDTVPAAGVIL